MGSLPGGGAGPALEGCLRERPLGGTRTIVGLGPDVGVRSDEDAAVAVAPAPIATIRTAMASAASLRLRRGWRRGWVDMVAPLVACAVIEPRPAG
jgi:hypothetical protein